MKRFPDFMTWGDKKLVGGTRKSHEGRSWI
jgi:hypothetical protein